MKRNKAELLQDVIGRLLREEGLETPLNEYRAVNAWAEVAGPDVARYTAHVYIRNQTLHVQLRSPALRANLMMRRRELADRINRHVGAFVVSDVMFY